MDSQRGITLIELAIVATLLAIAVTLAVPSYRSHMVRVQRTEASAELLRIRTAQEKFFLQNNAYTHEFGPTGLNLQPGPGATGTSDSGRYRFTVEIPDPASGGVSFLATAAAQGAQTADTRCTVLTLNDRGLRGATPGTEAECWK